MKLKSNNVMLEKLFFKLLPVQVLVVLMSSVNTIIDGARAGRYIDALTVGVVGLFFPMLNILNAFSNVLLGGTTVLCGRFMGSGDMEKTNGIFSLNLTCAFVVGAVVTVISFIIPEHLASILGARGDLIAPLVSYITGYAIGIIPLLLSQQISSFLQLERQTTLGYIGVIAMIISNVSMDILLVASFNMGIWGLALATFITNWIYFLILVSYYFTKRAQLHFDIRNSLLDSLPEVIKVSFPGALLILCLAFRGMVLNRIVLFYGAESGLSAMSAYNMTNGLFISYCIGNGSVVRMLSSIFIGEEDKDSLKQLLKIVFTKALALSCGIGAVIFVISPFLASVFFPDKSSEAYALTRYLFMIFSVSIPLILICQICTNYLQAGKHNLYINFLSVFDGFVSMIFVSLLLAPFMGILGIWFANLSE